MNSLITLLDDPTLSYSEKLKHVCEYAHEQIPAANLISLWVFNKDKSKMTSIVHLDLATGRFSHGFELCKSDFPSYFAAIIENELVVASDARSHSATKCFNQPYFEPNNIYSLLDFILHKDFQPIGVICCEATGRIVQWSNDDISNIRALAALISFFFELKAEDLAELHY